MYVFPRFLELIEEIKQCSKCKEELPKSSFSPDKRALDELQRVCRKCTSQRRKELYWKNPEKARLKRRIYFKENSEICKTIDKKTRLKNRKKLLQGKRDYYDKIKLDPDWQMHQKAKRLEDKIKKSLYDKEYRLKNSLLQVQKSRQCVLSNPEKRRAILSKYKAKRRLQEMIECDSISEVTDWLKVQEKFCFYCKKGCEESYHVDHYMPLTRGGKHQIINLKIACPTCNTRKNSKLPEDFIAQLKAEKII